MNAALINGADIDGQRMVTRMEGGRRIPLEFPIAIRRVTVYDDGNRMLVETVDGKITRFTVEQLLARAKATA